MAETTDEHCKSPRRIGEFRIPCSLLEDWEALLPFMANVIIVRAECRYDTRSIHYVAYSPAFDEVDPMFIPPQYAAGLERCDDGKLTIKFERLN